MGQSEFARATKRSGLMRNLCLPSQIDFAVRGSHKFLMCVIRLDNSSVQVHVRSRSCQTRLGIGRAKVAILSRGVPNLRMIARIRYQINGGLNGRYTCIIKVCDRHILWQERVLLNEEFYRRAASVGLAFSTASRNRLTSSWLITTGSFCGLRQAGMASSSFQSRFRMTL